MEKSGVELKKRLGLDKIDHVMISRVIGFSVPIYYLWYDTSRRIPITWNLIRYSPIISRLRFAPDLEKDVTMTPLIDIEDFNANLSNGIYITVDLAGKRLASDLLEFVTLKDLNQGVDISAITKRTIQQRSANNGSETANTKLTGSDIKGGHAFFYFSVDPTLDEEGDKLYKPTLNTTEKGKLIPSPDGMYHVTLKLLNFMDWYNTKPDGYEVKAKDIKEVLDTAYVQIHSDSPSFWYQGFAMRLSALDGAVHTPKVDKGMWKSKHGNSDYTLLDKHTARLIRQIAFYRNLMASSISGTLRRLKLR